MAKKNYKVKAGYIDATVCCRAPEIKRAEGGRFELSKCSQAELKYLHDVIEYPGVEVVTDEDKEK